LNQGYGSELFVYWLPDLTRPLGPNCQIEQRQDYALQAVQRTVGQKGSMVSGNYLTWQKGDSEHAFYGTH